MVATGEIALAPAVDVLAHIAPEDRAPVVERAKSNNNGKATAPAIVRAAQELGATTAKALKPTDAALREMINKIAADTSAGPLQKFLFGLLEWRNGELDEAGLWEMATEAGKNQKPRH
jgi:hypothetical protein